ncbi:MAG: hypothetical protein Q7P63_14485 [Verrucomicrobiota bacterium JB022]|nr:hypothetical protein [Verrucomicrobiota bacterium JB022]
MQILCRNGQGESALEEIEAALEQFPGNPDLHVIQAGVLRSLRQYGAAAGAYAQAAQLDRDNAAIWFGMGVCLESAGEQKGAFQAYAKAVSLEPSHGPAFFNLIGRLRKGRHHGKVIERLEAAPNSVRSHPAWFPLYAATKFESGDYRTIQQAPLDQGSLFNRNHEVAALRIRAMVYDPAVTGADLLAAARVWDRSFGPAKVDDLPLRDPLPDRPLRIGLVNTRMRRQNVGLQQLALMQNRPSADECTLHLYAANDVNDEVTEEMKRLSDSFTDISKLTDQAACERIRADQIDILVDFNEYANDGRLGVFARRAAPIQVHYYGNAVTTGLRAMDYRISDVISEPPGEADAASAEKIIRLEGGYHMYTPPPKPARLIFETPALSAGHVTFGAIHHLAKYNDGVLAAFRQILEALPNAHLVLARDNFQDPPTCADFAEKLKRHCLPQGRVHLLPDHGAIATLAIWQRIDCVLDSFPFSGDATTMDSLYAGVPMITLAGRRLASRRAASMLHLLGCPELVAENEEAYVAKAIELGRDVERLNAYRQTLHQKVEASPLRQHALPSRAFYTAIRRVWQDEVTQQA